MGRSGREFDVVLFGASGFTGELTAKYLAANAPPDVTWAAPAWDPRTTHI